MKKKKKKKKNLTRSLRWQSSFLNKGDNINNAHDSLYILYLHTRYIYGIYIFFCSGVKNIYIYKGIILKRKRKRKREMRGRFEMYLPRLCFAQELSSSIIQKRTFFFFLRGGKESNIVRLFLC